MRTFTIGEVLNRLKDEFDDITISKIRFLESEGLIHPDRTDSGYRKFSEHDVDRLRFVLRTQRDRYLPLKVIKEELDRLDADAAEAGGGAPPGLDDRGGVAAVGPAVSAPVGGPATATRSMDDTVPPEPPAAVRGRGRRSGRTQDGAPPAVPTSAGEREDMTGHDPQQAEQPDVLDRFDRARQDLPERRERPQRSSRTPGRTSSEVSFLEPTPTDVLLSITELCDSTGLEMGDVQALREHGLLRGEASFDGDDLQVARAATELMRLGLEPRHLRMYTQFADRELALYEQLALPLLKQRNPDSRKVASGQLDELFRNGMRLHRALLARSLRALMRT